MSTDPNLIKKIFLEAAEQPDEAARAAYLDRACGGDDGLRDRVDALLRSHDPSGSIRGTPAAALRDPNYVGTMAFDPSTPGGRPSSRDLDNESEGLHFLTPSTRPDSLGRIGHYEVLQVLGKGGFGIVLRAFDDVLQRVVAVKVLAPEMAATSPARKRFLHEARSYAQVRHENVVQVYAVEEQPLPYLVMEFIPGETLQQRLDRTGPLDVPETLRIGRQIAEGLAAAHANDLIHRDIKPGNVLLEGGQHRVKITDFGLARAADDASMTQSGMIAGTPMYMAPEQADGQPIDRRADLFSLGSVLYQMVAGRPPFRANTTVAMLKRVADDTPRSIREIIPETPQWLCDIIAKLHAKNPNDRYQSAREVADVLADCEVQLKAHARLKDFTLIPPPMPVPRHSVRRSWVAVVALGLPFLALGLYALTRPAAEPKVAGNGAIKPPTPDRIRDGGNPAPLAVAKQETPVPATQQKPPPLAIAPFDATAAKKHQEAWARYLELPVEVENKIGMKLILIPPANAALPQAYYLGKYEVTQGEWKQVMGYNTSGFGPQNPDVAGLDTSKFPVERVSWYDSVEFCNRLSEQEGKKPYYELTVTKRGGNKSHQIEEAAVKILGGNGYQIPRDDEWTYGCEAGSKTTYHFGDKDEELPEYAWFADNSDGRTHTVGEKKPNAFGLYDTHGNVREWIEKIVTNSEGASARVYFGGAWYDTAFDCEVGSRSRRAPDFRSHQVGLRVARVPSGAP